MMIDLRLAAEQVVELLTHVSDGQLPAPTPCAGTSVGGLIDHVDMLSLAFRAAARKEAGPVTGPPPRPDASRLGPDWRRTVPERVLALALAESWREPSSWQGTTQAGGLELPGDVAGTVALDELALHGWDLARAIGQPFACTPEAVAACTGFVASMSTPERESARQGLFGPALPVPDDATPFERLLRLAGRDPQWRPGSPAETA